MEFIDNTIIAIIACFFFAFISVLTGGFYVDKYIQLLSLTKRYSAFMKVTIRIVIFLFFIPAFLTFTAIKLLQNYIFARTGIVEGPGLANEVQTQALNISVFGCAFVILLVVFSLLLIRMSQTRKMMAYVPLAVCVTVAMIFFTQKIVLSFFIVCVVLSLVLLQMYRKSKIGEEL